MLVALIQKEARLFLRSRQWAVGLLVFALVLVVLCSFAFRRVGYGQAELRDLTPGILWTIFLFCGIVALSSSFLPEEELDAITGLLLTPADPAAMFLAKLIANVSVVFAVETLVIVLHSLFFGIDLFPVLPELMLLVLLVSIGFASLGTLFAAVAVAVRGRELVLPLMLFPLSLPLLAGAVFLTRAVLLTGAIPYRDFWFLLVVGFDVISVALSYSLFEFVVRE